MFLEQREVIIAITRIVNEWCIELITQTLHGSQHLLSVQDPFIFYGRYWEWYRQYPISSVVLITLCWSAHNTCDGLIFGSQYSRTLNAESRLPLTIPRLYALTFRVWLNRVDQILPSGTPTPNVFESPRQITLRFFGSDGISSPLNP